jgi:hypothetical protein
MAKRRGATEFAEDLGRLLGQAENKTKSWLSQRESVVQELTTIRDAASKYLSDLAAGGAELAAAVGRGRRRGRPPGTGKKRGPGRSQGSGARKRVMSAATRAKMREAAKRRWATAKKKTAKGGGKRKGRKGTDEQDVGNG